MYANAGNVNTDEGEFHLVDIVTLQDVVSLNIGLDPITEAYQAADPVANTENLLCGDYEYEVNVEGFGGSDGVYENF